MHLNMDTYRAAQIRTNSLHLTTKKRLQHLIGQGFKYRHIISVFDLIPEKIRERQLKLSQVLDLIRLHNSRNDLAPFVASTYMIPIRADRTPLHLVTMIYEQSLIYFFVLFAHPELSTHKIMMSLQITVIRQIPRPDDICYCLLDLSNKSTPPFIFPDHS